MGSPLLPKERRLLLVDDSINNLFVLEQVLTHGIERCRIDTAAQASEALELAARERFDVAIIDVQMPGIDGIELCRRLKSTPATATLPVILVTSHGTTSPDRARGLDMGADDFIHRPIDNVELVARVRAVLRTKRAEDAMLSLTARLETMVADRTEELRASQAELAASEAKYRGLVENAPIGIALLATDRDQVLFANETLARTLEHRSPDDLVRHGLASHWTHPDQFANFMHEVQARGRVQDFEAEARTATGTVRRLSITAQAETDQVLAMVRDVTEEKLTAERLADASTFNQLILETSPVGTLVFQESGRCVLANPAAAAIAGASVEQLLTLNFKEMESYERTGIRLAMERVLRTGEVLHQEVRTINTFGKEVWFDGVLTSVQLAAERHVVFSFFDVWERRRAEAERRDLQSQLHQTQKMQAVGTLAGGIAHDMNNVLGGTLMLASLLADRQREAGEEPEEAEQIMSLCRRGREMTRNLLGFARKGQQRMVVLSLPEVVREVAGLLRHTVPKGIELELELAEGVASVCGDPDQLNSVLMNLCVNAVSAMGTKGRLTIRCDTHTVDEALAAAHLHLSPGTYVRVEVHDTGVGMDAETLRRATEPFFTTKPQNEGTGLGLSMAYGTIEQHGGLLSIGSQLGRGTTVTVLLPAVKTGSLVVEPPSPAPRSSPARGTALLVDDEESIRFAGKLLLERLGYRVVVAQNGHEAMETCREHDGDFSVVILDLVMPGMDGEEAFHAMRETYPHLRVLLASGHARETTAAKLMDAGAVGFLQKPYDAKELQAALAHAIE